MLACAVMLMAIGDLPDQTFINDGLVFEVVLHSLGAVKNVIGERIYLKAERIVVSDHGLRLLCDDSSTILLPKIYSDQYGCYLMQESNEYDGL